MSIACDQYPVGHVEVRVAGERASGPGERLGVFSAYQVHMGYPCQRKMSPRIAGAQAVCAMKIGESVVEAAAKKVRDARPDHDHQVVGIGFHCRLNDCQSPIIIFGAEQQRHSTKGHQHWVPSGMLKSPASQSGTLPPVVGSDRRPAHGAPVLKSPSGVSQEDRVVGLEGERLAQERACLRIVLGGFRRDLVEGPQVDVVDRHTPRPFTP
jgi:hypothetical protein